MYITEVADHIGEHWRADGYTHPTGRVRIDGIQVVERRHGFRDEKIRRVRLVKVTYFDDDGNIRRHDPQTGKRSPDGEPRVALIEARDLAEPWAEYWGRELTRQEAEAAKRLVVKRLNAHLPGGYQIEFERWVPGLRVSIAAAGHLADLLDTAKSHAEVLGGEG
jgi:hypothetical protein